MRIRFAKIEAPAPVFPPAAEQGKPDADGPPKTERPAIRPAAPFDAPIKPKRKRAKAAVPGQGILL